MPAIGMGMLWGGYTLILWGYCQIKGYDITLSELVVPGRYKGKWPPSIIDDDALDKAAKDLGGALNDEIGKGTKKLKPKTGETGGSGSSGSSGGGAGSVFV